MPNEQLPLDAEGGVRVIASFRSRLPSAVNAPVIDDERTFLVVRGPWPMSESR